jgi:ABC-type sugar transport system ATPase subunit
MTLADRIVVMNNGRIEQVGKPLNLYLCACQRVRRRVHRLARD